MTALIQERSVASSRPGHRVGLRESLGVPRVDPSVVAAYRPRATELAERIVERIGREVTGLTVTNDPAVRRGTEIAVSNAVDLFVDLVAGAPAQGTEVLAFYRWLGRQEATAGHNLDAMQAAHHIATQESWTDLRRASVELGVPLEVHGPLGDALIAYQNLLFEQALMGFMAVRTSATREREEGRTELLVALLHGAEVAELAELACRCSWSLPESVSVAATAATDEAAAVVARTADALCGVRAGQLVVVAAPATTEELARCVVAETGQRVAVSWAVPSDQAHHAARWAGRGLSLLRDGVVDEPADGLLRCEDHQSRLSLHADPALRQLADEAVLAPLLTQTPKRRVALAETMLLWLQTRESAPALASRLGIHDQTVRHRLRRVRELFGARLSDPSQTTTLLVALESSLRLWQRATP